MAALSLRHSQTALGAYYRKMAQRLGGDIADADLQLAESHFMNDHGEIVVVGILPNGDEHVVGRW